MIIDFHAHVGTEAFGDAGRLRREYARAGINMGVLVPGGMIDVRRMTKYVTGEATPENPTPRNDLVEATVACGDSAFIGFYCADPGRGMAVVDEFDTALGRGFRGLKLAPIVHRFGFASPVVGALLEVAARRSCPVYAHTVFSPAASTARFGHLAAQHPSVRFVIGHMGFGPADVDAIELAARHDNVFLETSGGSFLAIEEAVRVAGSEKLLFGSEFPLQSPAVELRKIEVLDLGSAAFARVVGGNAATLLNLENMEA